MTVYVLVKKRVCFLIVERLNIKMCNSRHDPQNFTSIVATCKSRKAKNNIVECPQVRSSIIVGKMHARFLGYNCFLITSELCVDEKILIERQKLHSSQ